MKGGREQAASQQASIQWAVAVRLMRIECAFGVLYGCEGVGRGGEREVGERERVERVWDVMECVRDV